MQSRAPVRAGRVSTIPLSAVSCPIARPDRNILWFLEKPDAKPRYSRPRSRTASSTMRLPLAIIRTSLATRTYS